LKRVVTSSIIAVLIISLAAGLYFYLQGKKSSELSDFHSIPANANFIIEYNHKSGNLRSYLESESFDELTEVFGLDQLATLFSRLDSICENNPDFCSILSQNRLLISAHMIKANDFDYLYIMKASDLNGAEEINTIIAALSGYSSDKISKRKYEGTEIIEIGIDKKIISYTLDNNILAISTTPFLVEDVIRQRKLGTPLIKGQELVDLFISDKPSDLTLYYNNREMAKWISMISPSDWVNSLSMGNNWTMLSLSDGKDDLNLLGENLSEDSVTTFALFKDNGAVIPTLPDFLPQKTISFQYYGCSNVTSYLQKRISIENDRPQQTNPIVKMESQLGTNAIDAIGRWYSGEVILALTSVGTNSTSNTLVMLGISSRDKTIEFLKKINESGKSIKTEKYKNHSILNISSSGLIPAITGLAYDKTYNYSVIIENRLIMSSSLSQLKTYIDDTEQNRLLKSDQTFQENRASVLVRINSWSYLNSREYFKSNQNKTDFYSNHFPTLNALSSIYGMVNYIYSSSTNQVQCLLKRNQQDILSIDQLWSFKLDSGVVSGPYIVNYNDSSFMVLAQDVSNNLICLDASGNTKWTKPIGEKILSNLYPVHLYTNELTQLMFNTGSYLYMLDDKGANVSNFPIRLPTQASNGIALIYSEKEKKDHIYVACYNGKIYAYEINGKASSNWSFNELTSEIKKPISKIIYQNKEALIFEDGQHIYTLTLNGGILLKQKPSFTKSSNTELQQGSNNSIALSDENGVYIQINSTDEINSVLTGPFTSQHSFLCVNEKDSSMLIYCENGVLYRYSNNGSLQKEIRFGSIESYCPMTYFENKIYVSDLTGSKVYAFNLDLTLSKGFPVNCSGEPKFIKMKNGNQYMVNNDTEGAIILFKLN